MKRLLVCLIILLGPQVLAQEDWADISSLVDAAIKKAIENNELKKSHVRFKKKEIRTNLNKPDSDPEKKEGDWGVGIKNEDLKVTPQDISSETHEFSFNRSLLTPNGYLVYEVNFKPRPNLPPAKNAFLEVANRSSGTMWIDPENLYVVSITGQMPADMSKAFSAGLGFGNIKWVKYEINQSRRAELNNLIVIDSVKVRIKYRILWLVVARHYYEEYTYEYSNYVYIP